MTNNKHTMKIIGFTWRVGNHDKKNHSGSKLDVYAKNWINCVNSKVVTSKGRASTKLVILLGVWSNKIPARVPVLPKRFYTNPIPVKKLPECLLWPYWEFLFSPDFWNLEPSCGSCTMQQGINKDRGLFAMRANALLEDFDQLISKITGNWAHWELPEGDKEKNTRHHSLWLILHIDVLSYPRDSGSESQSDCIASRANNPLTGWPSWSKNKHLMNIFKCPCLYSIPLTANLSKQGKGLFK